MLHQVGVGALGPVFRTYEPTRDRLVAVKVFRLDITPEQAASLADALSTAAEAGLFHPSVVEPIASGIEGTVAYRAEEYVAAESLDVALRHYAPAALDKALPFLTQLAGAIDFARAAGVGHGALHPRDIFVTPDEARATGFGVVEALEKVGLRAPVRRPYSAPERVDGKAWGAAADVFSLAVIAYELLTARRPSGTGSAIGALGELGGEHADAVHDVLARAMDDDPAKRYQTALAFVSALEKAAREGTPADGAVIPTPPAVALPATVAAAAATAAARPSPPAADAVPTDDQIDDSLTAMPPAIVPDDQDEPAETALEEDTFRAEPPILDDVAPEDDEDEEDELEEDFAGRLPTLTRSADAGHAKREGKLFDDVGDDDFDLATPPARFMDDFDAEPVDELREPEAEDEEDVEEEAEQEEPVRSTLAVTPAYEPPVAATPPRGYSSITEPPPVVERSRRPVLPYALILMLGLFLGWMAHMYSTRNATPSAPAANTPAAAPATPQQGKEFSEQAVAPTPQQPDRRPPAEPPAVPSEVPAATPSTPARGTTKPPAQPPAAAPTTGTIVVNSTPPGAGVTVDGKWMGRTPLTLEKLRFGSYTIRIVQTGYTVERHVVPINAQLPSRTVTAKLQRPEGTKPKPQPTSGPGSIYVDSRPRGARVFLDDKAVGVTPLQLTDISAGEHRVRLELADHQTWRTTTTVTTGRQARVTGSLERIR